MDLTRPLDLKLKSTNIHKVLEDILTLEKDTLTRKNGRFEQIYDPSLPPIEADEDQLKQVFLNLIKNAIEASRKGGKSRSSPGSVQGMRSNPPLPPSRNRIS